MKNKLATSNKWYKDPIFYAIVSIPFIITITLFFVIQPAWFNWFILDSESGHIGNAIGGVGAVIVGIANVVMLYLTFKRQGDSLNIEREKLKQDQENNRYINLQEQLDNIRQSWSSNKISNYIKTLESNDNTKSSESSNTLDIETICETVLLFFSQLYNILLRISKIKKENKEELLQEAKDFYEYFMKPQYKKIINKPTKEIKMSLEKNNGKIEKILYQ